MEPRDPAGKEGLGARRKNLHFLRLYMLERRKTDTVLEGSAPGERSGPLRRTQSDRSEYSQKLQEKMTPQAGCCAAGTPPRDEEQQMQRMMAKRAKVITELIQTEQDYVRDLELCVSHVVQPLRNQQIDGLDVDSLFSNIESVLQVSARLLALLEEATAGVEPDAQVIGEVFLQLKGPLEDIYKIYCYHHDEAQGVLEAYEREEELKRHLSPCLQSLKGKPNLLDMGSLMIRPIQRVMKYPLLLCELRNATPASHPDFGALQDACAAVRDINVNINELKRRKDLVLKYKKSDEDESLKDKLSRLNIHSISKKSKRVTNHLMLLTRGEAQINTVKGFERRIQVFTELIRPGDSIQESLSLMDTLQHQLGLIFHSYCDRQEILLPLVRDSTFDREEKLFRALEKTVRHCVKNTSCWLQHVQEAVPLALQTVTELQEVSCSTEEEGHGTAETPRHAPDPRDDFAGQFQRLVLTPLSSLLALFPGPQKLIQKRYDKLLDYTSSRPRAVGEQPDLARREYEALNAQLVEELRVFNREARAVLLGCLHSLLRLLRELARLARSSHAAWLREPPSAPSASEIQTRVLEEVQNLNFVKDNSATFIERKLSFEKKKPVPTLPEAPRQTDTHRSQLLSTYSLEELYQAKRKCHASQECDISLLEGDLVAVLEQKDPLGSSSRWLVDTGAVRGYVYSSFLKPYNPARGRRAAADSSFTDDDFENISLFVSSRPASASATGAPEGSTSDSSSSLSGTCGRGDTNGTDAADGLQEVEEQIFYAVHAFQARSDHELSLQEYQRVHILRFCDLSGNKEWWLAEAQGHKGYVPANYLGKMTYA